MVGVGDRGTRTTEATADQAVESTGAEIAGVPTILVVTGVSGSGLYEDAILLGRLRRALKETDGIPDSLPAMATVRDARAFLKIDDTLPAPSAARAIDAALRTPGVNSVQARIAG